MTEKDLDIAIEKCERIMEFDTRTLESPESNNGWIFEKVYDLLQFLRQSQFATDINVGDTISRQAAIDAVRKAKDKSEAHRMLIQMPSAQPGWIPCKTALPEHDGEYLVTKKSFGWNCKEYIETDIARYEKKDGWHKADQILAWQPLPKLWEGGQE